MNEDQKELRISSHRSPLLNSNMYIVHSGNHVIIIDPFESAETLQQLKLSHMFIDYGVLTHEHYDHISGVNWLKDNCNCRILCSKACGQEIESPGGNFSKYFDVLAQIVPIKGALPEFIEPYSCRADETFDNSMEFLWQGHRILMIETPGIQEAVICVLIDNKYLFSGDTLLKDYPTVTQLKGGSRRLFIERTLLFLESLSTETKVFPGHYDSFMISERRNYLANYCKKRVD
mgnify:CR=1 FL=1